MKTNKSIFIAFSFLLFSFTYSFSQEITTTTGGIASGTGGTATFTVGQVVYTPSKGVTGSMDEVMQQPYEISDLSANKLPAIQLYMAVYPNPVTDALILEVENTEISTSFILYDASGKSLQSHVVADKKTAIDMRNYFKGFYFLKVYRNNSEIKSFKIIKK